MTDKRNRSESAIIIRLGTDRNFKFKRRLAKRNIDNLDAGRKAETMNGIIRELVDQWLDTHR